MTQSISYATAEPVPGNSRGGLIAMGVVSIVLGALAGCVAALTPVGLIVQRMAPQQPVVAPPVASVVSGMLIYVAVATALIWTGIGSCRCRRWCRAVVLVVAWPALVTGVLGVAALAAVLPAMSRTMAAAGAPPGGAGMPQGFFLGVMIGTVVASSVFYVGLPALYLWFYRRPQTKLTLDALDPRPNWTDGRPLPVLGLSIWMAVAAAGTLSALAYGVAPLFGTFVTGPAAAVVLIAAAAAIAWGARQAYHVRAAGWWAALAFAVLAPASWEITVGIRGLRPFYELAGFPVEQVDQIEQFQGSAAWATIAFPLLSAALVVAFLIYARRFFFTAPAPGGASDVNA
ncbi:MAG TPA: hypothetical protein VK324_16530 [Tepidisphaeraceae bacterium]|nr:hypothetical protein [Tepidisphaeraceae bacterium]